MALVILILLLL